MTSVFYRYYQAPTLANASAGAFPAPAATASVAAAAAADLLRGNGSEAAAAFAASALPGSVIQCTRERPVLCLLLMLGTLWMGYTLYQFKRRYVLLESSKFRLGGGTELFQTGS